MKKHLSLLLALVLLSIQAFSQTSGSFDIYGYGSRFGPKTEAYFDANNFKYAALLTHAAIFGTGDDRKFNSDKIRYYLDKNFPGSNASGMVVIDWETSIFKDLRNYPTYDSRFKNAESQFIGLVNLIHSYRPNVKVGIYGITFTVWNTWQKENYNPAGKYDNLLSKTDFLAPSVYIVYPDEQVGHERNLRFLKDNLDASLAYGKKYGIPVLPFVWHRVHYNEIYDEEILQKEVFASYIKYIADYSSNNYKAKGVIWWDEASERSRIDDLSGINNHLVGKLEGTGAVAYDNLMLDFAKAVKQALGSTTTAPAPAPAPIEGQQVVSFTLFDASTKKEIQTITNGATLNLASLPTKNLNIRANTNTTVGSVKFWLSGEQSKSATESIAPYDIMGDDGSWTPAVGSYTLNAIPYVYSGGGGAAGASLSVNFTVTNSTSSNSTPEGVSFTLINADTDKEIATLPDGATLNLASLPTKNLNIRYNADTETGKVAFSLTGAQSHSKTESGAPYAVFGGTGSNYRGWTLIPGSYSLKATPYSSSGSARTAVTISFKVVDQFSSASTQAISFDPTAAASMDAGEKLVAYPNPASNMLYVVFDEAGEGTAVVNFYSIDGRLVQTQEEKLTASGVKAVVDVSKLQRGIYILEVATPGGRTTQRVVVK